MSIVQAIYEADINISEEDLKNKIIDNPDLTTLDFWLLPEYPFTEWRKKHDYPKILEAIKNSRKDFTEWMENQNITDDDLIGWGMSKFFDTRYLSKGKKKILVKITKEEEKESYVVCDELKPDALGPAYTCELVKEFFSYYDWLFIKKGIIYSLLDDFEHSYPNTEHEQVRLFGKYRLIKMGGCAPPTNIFGQILRSKTLEFVNATGLQLDGVLSPGLGSVSFEHSAVDNMKCNNLRVPNFSFEGSSVKNIQIINSNLPQWLFITSEVTGNIIDSRLTGVRIYGGQFTPSPVNSTIEIGDIDHKLIRHHRDFEKTYRFISKCYKDSGNKSQAIKYKIAEMDFIKSKSGKTKKALMWLEKIYWEYGQKPKRLIWITLGAIFLFGVIYSLSPSYFKDHPFENMSYPDRLANSIYYSVVTFTTLGSGDLSPIGFLRWVTAFEAVFGVVTLSFLIGGLSKSD